MRRADRRAGHALNVAAGTGPSGWSNALIVRLLDTPYGISAILTWVCMVARGELRAVEVSYWGASAVAPVSQGKLDAEGKPKFRPVGLLEALLKLAEGITVASDVPRVRRRC